MSSKHQNLLKKSVNFQASCLLFHSVDLIFCRSNYGS